ncbi:hypothetical protein AWR27_02930 [Spirosoma montaniterrae]|uniref:Uncharacterized protein n=1 Tax=Spirosoma montaniterrae TaxID=1178516 RepID=A0A1P9X3V5_9BACT|nr:hypothetical protein AWR27_02930 [Spirosoma montaniterrae]
MVVTFASCSRPVAYFQKSQRETFTAAPVATAEIPVPVVAEPVAPTPVGQATPVNVAQANAALDQMDALVRNDAKLATNRTVQKRLNRVRTMLASASEKTTLLAPAAGNARQKVSLMERLMVKKMNRKLNQQVAPDNTKKAMANTGLLSAGAVAVIIGLLVLLLGGSGTLGVILLLAGAIVLVLGLLAS